MVLTSLGAVDSWPGTLRSAAVVWPDGRVELHGPAEVPFRWASVTKVVMTLATLVAVEEGTLDLDQPAGPPGATLRHLLSHASGLGPDGAVLSAPGRRRVYTNVAIEIAGELLAARSGMTAIQYVRDAVLSPLGMAGTRIEGSVATGAVGPVADLAAVASEMLSPVLVTPSTLDEATRVAFPGLPGVLPGVGQMASNDWGLGFEVRDSKSPHWTGTANSPETVGHFGASGGFVWMDRRAGVACAAMCDAGFGPWALEAWPHLSDEVLAAVGKPGAGERH